MTPGSANTRPEQRDHEGDEARPPASSGTLVDTSESDGWAPTPDEELIENRALGGPRASTDVTSSVREPS